MKIGIGLCLLGVILLINAIFGFAGIFTDIGSRSVGFRIASECPGYQSAAIFTMGILF